MKAALHHQTTQSPVRPRSGSWSHNAGHQNPKSFLNSRLAGFKRWAGEFSYRLATNRYVFYGSLILAACVIAATLTKGHEVLWRSTASLGIATIVIGFIHAWLDARSGREDSRSHRKRRAKKP